MRIFEQHRLRQLVAAMLCLTLIVGCGTMKEAADPEATAETKAAEKPAEKAATDNDSDPLEGFNRAMFTFNLYWDDYVMRPAAKGYQAVVPKPLRVGISNFFSNLFEPVTVVNDLLQGKGKQAGSDFLRFIVNTTLGIFGLFDVASEFGLEKNTEDFGQTFAVWGMGEGAYLVLPFLGPSSLRDGVGLYLDYQAYPVTYVDNEGHRNSALALGYLSLRADLLDATDILDQAIGAEDRYVFVREAWRQRRRSQIHDGQPPVAPPPDILFEDDPPAPKAPSADSKPTAAQPPARE